MVGELEQDILDYGELTWGAEGPLNSLSGAKTIVTKGLVTPVKSGLALRTGLSKPVDGLRGDSDIEDVRAVLRMGDEGPVASDLPDALKSK